MIDKIHFLKSIGSFTDFANKQLEFKHVNLGFGLNYSGKTTLSRFIQNIDATRWTKIQELWPGCSFSLEYKGQRYTEKNVVDAGIKSIVFNSVFCEENANWLVGKKAKGLKFDIGENVPAREKLVHVQKKIETAKKELDLLLKLPVIASYEAFEKPQTGHFVKLAKKIKDFVDSREDVNKGHITSKYLPLLTENNVVHHASFNSDELNLLLEQSKESPLPKIEPTIINIKSYIVRILIDEVNTLLSETIIPDKETLINFVTQEGREWVRQGLQVNAANEPCSFCGSLVTPERYRLLQAVFREREKELRSKIKTIISMVEDQERKVALCRSVFNADINKHSFYISHQADYFQIEHSINQFIVTLMEYLNKIRDRLVAKLDSMSQPVDAISDNINVHTLLRDLVKLKAIIDQNNRYTEAIQQKRKEAIHKIALHFTAQMLAEKAYFSTKKEYDEAIHQIKERKEGIGKLETEELDLQAQIESYAKGAQAVTNHFCNFFGKSNMVVEADKEGYFQILRDGYPVKDLSEGEKTGVLFCYFITMLTQLDERGELKDYIVFLDDPITSLDINHISQIYSWLNKFFVKNRRVGSIDFTKCSQLFITTHHVTFLKYLLDSSFSKYGGSYQKVLDGKGDKGFYQIKRIGDGSSIIETMPKYLLDATSDYCMMWHLVVNFDINNPFHKSHIGNAIRRILELYTLMLFPSMGRKTLEERMDKFIAKHAGASFFHVKVLHDQSHNGNIDAIELYDGAQWSLPEYVPAFYQRFKLIDPDHIKSIEEVTI